MLAPGILVCFRFRQRQCLRILRRRMLGWRLSKRCVSKIASSPTKNGEYLACGLPLIINAGVGDSDALINDWKAGVLIEEFTEEEYAEAGRSIEAMVAQPEVRKSARCSCGTSFLICKQDWRRRDTRRFTRKY